MTQYNSVKTLFRKGDIVEISDAFEVDTYHATEDGKSIYVPESMMNDMHGKIVEIRGVHIDNYGSISYYTDQDPGYANGGDGWRWPACLLSYAAKPVEIKEDSLLDLLL